MHYFLIICCTLKLIFSVGCSPHVPRDLSYYLDPYEDAKDINAARNLEEATSYSKKLVTPKVGSIFDGEFLQGFLVLDKDKGSGEVKAALEGKFLFIDGDNKNHLEWAKSHDLQEYRLVIVRGERFNEVQKQAQIHKRPGLMSIMKVNNGFCFYDTYGLMFRKAGVERLPSRVSQQGTQLLVEEVPIEKTLRGE